ncbi:5-oxoprolinase subunit PxpB [Heliomicrobium gestii]|uniref:5-oxoprolinase subunit PxpB n=1 Tax=Heliomicrobium gestii TaxID=2699 RepID=UPI001F1D53CD|nr:5-oxoprolinase subunit PxpB [Heliomicrobium gestii]MBM7868415.1 KipI family sensor histidine kinase inhibitor [Heliomicrobium gestii]
MENCTKEHKVRLLPMGDSCWLVQFDQEISPEINGKVHALAATLAQGQQRWLREIVPTYCALAVYYDPLQIDAHDVECYLWAELSLLKEGRHTLSLTWEVPVLYGGEWGPDLAPLALRSGMKPDEVIALHAGKTYHLYMLGFVPGFCYLGKVPARIAAPRHAKPRKAVPAGSIGIAGEQTGIYPIEAPGGWQIIGRTPVTLYDPRWEPPALMRPGDRVRFRPIDLTTYHIWSQKSKSGWRLAPVEGTSSSDSEGHQRRFTNYRSRYGALWASGLGDARCRRDGHLFIASSQPAGRQ